MTRVVALVIVVLLSAGAADAQPPSEVPHVGFSISGSGSSVVLDAFRQGLRELGYVEGKTIALEVRSAEGKPERFPEIMKEFVRLGVRVIVAGGGVLAARAAREATKAIPIVTPAVADPISLGLVTSLARPGGNLTGLSMQNTEISAKRLELLKIAVPALRRVVLLHEAASERRQVAEATEAARTLGVQSHVIEVRDAAGFDAAFLDIRKQRADAVVVLASSLFNAHRRALVERIAAIRVPAVWETSEFTDAGALMSYGPSFWDLYRRAAVYVDKILKGANPGDLPIEQPTKFDLVVNARTAKALGLRLPDALLQRADRVIE